MIRYCLKCKRTQIDDHYSSTTSRICHNCKQALHDISEEVVTLSQPNVPAIIRDPKSNLGTFHSPPPNVDELEATQALAYNPYNPEALLHLGKRLKADGKTDHSAIILKKIEDDSEYFVEAKKHLADIYLSRKDYALAEPELEELLRFEPENPKTHYNMGHALLAENKIQLALDHLKVAYNSTSSESIKKRISHIITILKA